MCHEVFFALNFTKHTISYNGEGYAIKLQYIFTRLSCTSKPFDVLLILSDVSVIECFVIIYIWWHLLLERNCVCVDSNFA